MPDLFSANDARMQSRRLSLASVEIPFRVLALNLQNAGQERLSRILSYLTSSDADILVLTEVRNKVASKDFFEHLSLLGYQDAELPDCGPDAYHSVVLRSVHGRRMQISTTSLKSRAAITRITIKGADSLYVVGLYAPSFNGKNTNEREVFFKDLDQRVLRRIAKSKDNILLLGDLNLVESHFHEHLPDFAKESSKYLSMLEAHGLIDTVRRSYPKDAKYTWFSPMTGKGQRLDHVFSSNSVLSWVESITVDDKPRNDGLSDHSAIQINICPKSSDFG